MVVSGEGAVAKCRSLMGATNPAEAAPGTIRGDFGLIMDENVIHGSDSPESAERENRDLLRLNSLVDSVRSAAPMDERSGGPRLRLVFWAIGLREHVGAAEEPLLWKETEPLREPLRTQDVPEQNRLCCIASLTRRRCRRSSPPSWSAMRWWRRSSGNKYVFSAVDSFDEIALDYPTTIASPKKYLLPPEETLFEFDARENEVTDYADEVRPRVLFGVHACDINGLQNLSSVFNDPRYPDPLLCGPRRRHAHRHACMPSANCFCHFMDAPRRRGPPTTCSCRTSADATSSPSSASWRRTSWRRPATRAGHRRGPYRVRAPPPARARRRSTGHPPTSGRPHAHGRLPRGRVLGRAGRPLPFLQRLRERVPHLLLPISATRWIRARRGGAPRARVGCLHCAAVRQVVGGDFRPDRPPACGTACTTSSTAFWPNHDRTSAWAAAAAFSACKVDISPIRCSSSSRGRGCKMPSGARCPPSVETRSEAVAPASGEQMMAANLGIGRGRRGSRPSSTSPRPRSSSSSALSTSASARPSARSRDSSWRCPSSGWARRPSPYRRRRPSGASSSCASVAPAGSPSGCTRCSAATSSASAGVRPRFPHRRDAGHDILWWRRPRHRPLRSLINNIHDERSEFGKESSYTVSRSPGGHVPQPVRDVEAPRGFDLYLTVDHPDDTWDGEVGLVTKAVRARRSTRRTPSRPLRRRSCTRFVVRRCGRRASATTAST